MNFPRLIKHLVLTLVLFLLVITGTAAEVNTPIDYKWPLDVTATGKKVILSGKVNVKKYSAEQLKSFALTLFYNKVKMPPAKTEPFVGGFYNIDSYKIAEKTPETFLSPPDEAKRVKATAKIVSGPVSTPITNIAGVVADIEDNKSETGSLIINPETGEYFFELPVDPGERYYYAQKLETLNGIEVKIGEFDSTKGRITQKSADDDFERRSYRLLSGFPGLSVLLDPDLCLEYIRDGKIPADHKFCTADDPSGFGGFINYAFRMMIGISAVLLVLRIMLSGYQYVVTDVPFLKTSAKAKLAESFFGLLLALSAYLLLNTINPKLVSNKIAIQQIELTVNYPDAGDDTVDPNFSKGKYVYRTDVAASAGTLAVVEKLKQGWVIDTFKISPSPDQVANNSAVCPPKGQPKSNPYAIRGTARMLISLKRGNEVDNTNFIDVGFGANGFAPIGKGRQGDCKTPLGKWAITTDIRYKAGVAQFNSLGSNMGAAFWHLTPMTSGERGIGMHGNEFGTVNGNTWGCIRIKNSDILLLQPYIKSGTPVLIGV